MTRKLPPLNSLRAFEAAARLGSFAAAAQELHVTPGAVSRHIAQLEAWLDTVLFERLNRRVMPTEAGRIYARELGAALDNMAASTRCVQTRARRTVLRVDSPPSFTLHWLIPRLSDFQQRHPDVEVSVAGSNASLEQARQSADVVIRGGPCDAQGWTAQEFLTETRLPVCAPSLLARQALSRVEDLRRHTLLHTATYPEIWSEWLALAGMPALRPRQDLTFEHFYMTLQAAIGGLGVAIGPQALVAEDIARGRLVHPFAFPRLPPWRYFFFVSPERAEEPAIQALNAWLRAQGQGIPFGPAPEPA